MEVFGGQTFILSNLEIGGMQKWCIDQMMEGIVIEVLTGMVLRGIKGTKDLKAGIDLIGIIKGSITIKESISLEIAIRVKILVKGDRRHGGRSNFLNVQVDQDD
ncbi:hypothetical protein TNCV_161251 [Trichonephila clavipes]|nr:hypothetical protein TNCV_161251 [Trichonephila clavipes]